MLRRFYYLFKRVKSRHLLKEGHLNTFVRYYKDNFWSDKESVSGSGSNLHNTRELRKRLQPLITRPEVSSILDIPCGDFRWMREVNLGELDYIGADLVPELIERLNKECASNERNFKVVDLLADELPKADVILCRDCLVHFSYESIGIAIQAMKRSGAKYLATTYFPKTKANYDIVTGDWRRLNFMKKPFLWCEPVDYIDELSTEGGSKYADKRLGLWKLEDIDF